MMATVARLVGGPMGGETRAFAGPPEPRLLVPMARPVPLYLQKEDVHLVTYETELYELRRTGGAEYVYQWVDDRPRMREELDRLREQVKAVRKAVNG